MTVLKLLTEHHLEFICFTGGCTGSYESTLVKMPQCRNSHVVAQLFSSKITKHFCSIPARSHTFVKIAHEIISMVILLLSADSFKKGCCQLQAKVSIYLSIYLSIHSAAPSFRVLRAVALSVQELKERL